MSVLAAAQPQIPPRLALVINKVIASMGQRGHSEDYTWLCQLRDGTVYAEADGLTWSEHVCGGGRFDAPPGLVAWLVVVRGDGGAHHLLQIPDGAAAFFTRRKGVALNTGQRGTFATILGARNGEDGRYWFFAPAGLITVSDDLNAV